MKKQVLMVLTTLSLFVTLAAVSVYAQSDMRLNVNIPFEFTVGHKTLPAGEYTVKYVAHTALMIQSADCTTSQIFFANPTGPGKRRYEASLVFNQYGDRYFLSTIWTATNDTGLELGKADAEWELIRARRALALTASAPKSVAIAAHRQ